MLPTWKNAIETIGKDFTGQTGIQVEASILPFDDLYEKALLDARLGTERDLISVESTWTGAFYGSGAIVPADTFFGDKALADPNYDNGDIMNSPSLCPVEGPADTGSASMPLATCCIYRDNLFSDPDYQKQFQASTATPSSRRPPTRRPGGGGVLQHGRLEDANR